MSKAGNDIGQNVGGRSGFMVTCVKHIHVGKEPNLPSRESQTRGSLMDLWLLITGAGGVVFKSI